MPSVSVPRLSGAVRRALVLLAPCLVVVAAHEWLSDDARFWLSATLAGIAWCVLLRWQPRRRVISPASPGKSGSRPAARLRLPLLFCIALGIATIAAAQQPTVHVSTSTDPSGLVDAATVERQKAVAAIRKRLTSRKNLRVVQNPAEATISIDVTSVSREPVWQPTMYAPAKPLTPGEPLPEGTRPLMVARAVLTRGTFTTSFAEAAGAFRASATENLARSIDAWFRANERTLATSP